MVTLKLKKPATPAAHGKPERAPLRGANAGIKKRPTLAQAQAEREDTEARYQEQLRLRYGNAPAQPSRGRAPAADSRRPAPQRPAGARDERPRSRPVSASEREADHRHSTDRNAPRPDARTPSRQPGPRPGARGAQYPDTRPPARAEWASEARNTAFGQRPAPGARVEAPAYRGTPRNAPAHTAPDAAPFDSARFEQERAARLQAEARRGARGNNNNTPWGPRADAPYNAAPRVAPKKPRHVARHDDDDDDYAPAEHLPGSMRLSKRMSELGMASRREADEWIDKGLVRVDGTVVRELGSRVLPDQKITIDLQAREQQAQRVTVLINKPVGYVSGQAEDGYEPALVLVTPPNQWHEDHSGTAFRRDHLRHLVPAGRLDIDSVGLLVLTQDGRIAKQLIGENSEIEKEYLVRVQMQEGGTLPESGLALLQHGLSLDGEALRPAQVEWVNEDQLRFVLREGKKRQIRRMCEAVGLAVLGLKRVRIGRVMLGDLPPGQWRYLRRDEGFAG